MEKLNATLKNENSDVPPHIWAILHEFLLGVDNKELDLQKAHLRPSIENIYPFFIFIYAVLIVIGVITNFAVAIHIVKHKLYRDTTYCFIINGVISDILKCVVVLPISLYVLLIQNWILGELLCSFLPMLQDIPLHISILTFLLIAWDRFRYVRNPSKPRLPACVCSIGTWLTAFCLVLPYPIYITYVDLGIDAWNDGDSRYKKEIREVGATRRNPELERGRRGLARLGNILKYMESFHGVGICIVNLQDDMQEYMRGIFLITYAGPLATICYLHVKTSRELQTQESSLAVVMFEARSRESRSRTDSHSTTTDFRGSRGESDRISQFSRGSFRDREACRARYEIYETELDVAKEKRNQKYIVLMVTIYAVFLCPLMVLRLARLALLETYDNSGHFDIVYTTFVWFAFLPTCSTPLLFSTWQMSRPAKERLRGYFRFNNHKLRQSCEAVITAAGGTPVRRSRNSSSQGDSLVRRIEEEPSTTTISLARDSVS